jgi:hypothetical protein
MGHELTESGDKRVGKTSAGSDVPFEGYSTSRSPVIKDQDQALVKAGVVPDGADLLQVLQQAQSSRGDKGKGRTGDSMPTNSSEPDENNGLRPIIDIPHGNNENFYEVPYGKYYTGNGPDGESSDFEGDILRRLMTPSEGDYLADPMAPKLNSSQPDILQVISSETGKSLLDPPTISDEFTPKPPYEQ